MTETASYTILLIMGVVLTLIVGAVLLRSGQSLLDGEYPPARAASLVRLVTVGYVLVALGVLAVISTIPLPIDGALQLMVTKLGVILLVLGAAYALTLRVFGRLRDAQREEELEEEYHQAVRDKS